MGADLNKSGMSKYASPFALLIANGADIDEIEWCIEHGAKVSLENAKGYTPLQAAASVKNDPEMKAFEFLLKNGAEITEKNRISILSLLMENAPFEFVNEMMMKHSINGRKQEVSILQAAINSGKVEKLALAKEFISALDEGGIEDEGCLLSAYEEGGVEMLKELIDLFDIKALSNPDRIREIREKIFYDSDVEEVELLIKAVELLKKLTQLPLNESEMDALDGIGEEFYDAVVDAGWLEKS